MGQPYKGRLNLRLMVIGLLALLFSIIPSPALAGELTSYDIRANLNYAQGTLEVRQTIRYPNRTGANLDSIVFNVTPARLNAFELIRATAQGQPVSPSLSGVVMEAPLPTALRPGATATVELDYRLELPRPGNLRFGKGASIVALGNWYPVVNVYRASVGDWERHSYTDIGDSFFTETADYRVTLVAEVPLTVAHTGRLVSQQGSQWVLEAKGVRDFAIAASDAYVVQTQVVDGVTVSAFYLPEHADGGAEYLRSAVESIRWMNQAVGPFPYSSLHVAETATGDPVWVGQEYPGIVFISNQITARGGGLGSYLNSLVVHEVIHQWFYSAVGNDQLYEPWLDEALTTYLTYEFYRLNYPDLYPAMWQGAVGGARVTAERWGDRPLNTSIYDYDNENHYFGLIYRKGSLFLDELRLQMGDEAFYGFLKQYYITYSGRIATGPDFLDLALSMTEANLRPLITSYFSYPGYDKEPTPSPTPTETAVPSPTPSPSSTATPVPKSTPTETALPTATSMPSPVAPLSSTPTAGAVQSSSPAVAGTTPVPSPTAFDQPSEESVPAVALLVMSLIGLGVGVSAFLYRNLRRWDRSSVR